MAIPGPRRTKISTALLVLTFVLAAADWLNVWKGWRRASWITKPGTLLALLAWFSLSGGWQGQTFWFGLGLVFALAGDVLLLQDGYFLAGLVAFLLTHLFYIFGFNPTSIPLEPLSVGLTVVVWLGAILFFRRVGAAVRANENTAALQYPIFMYSLAISIMLLSALVTLARPEWPLAAALLSGGGGLLFALSDGLLATDRFIRPISHGQLWVRITYHLGQIALIAGVLMRYGLLAP